MEDIRQCPCLPVLWRAPALLATSKAQLSGDETVTLHTLILINMHAWCLLSCFCGCSVCVCVCVHSYLCVCVLTHACVASVDVCVSFLFHFCRNSITDLFFFFFLLFLLLAAATATRKALQLSKLFNIRRV